MDNGQLKIIINTKMENVIVKKSYAFAIRIIRLYQFLSQEKKEYILSKQLLRCGTAIGAMVKESEHAQSKADFLNKMNVALKEANETEYWLMLLRDTEYINKNEFGSMSADCAEILRLLISIVKSTKISLKK
jgi:four helix bundle protein